MKKDEYEIYSVRFNKLVTDKDIHFTTYTVGSPSFVMGEMVIPDSIIQVGIKRIVINFNNNTSLNIGFTDDVQIFKRRSN